MLLLEARRLFMSEWVSHLIVADRVLEILPKLRKHEFCVGNIAPDCNMPNEDGTEFIPPRKVTHWMTGERKTAADMRAFYDEYIEKPIVTFIAHRFEEICRTYFSLKVRSGKMRGVRNIGTYYYDDGVNHTNGEYDVVLKRRDTFDIYEVKYYAEPLSAKEMDTILFDTAIRECVKTKEAQDKKKLLIDYAPNCNTCVDYVEFVNQLLTLIRE